MRVTILGNLNEVSAAMGLIEKRTNAPRGKSAIALANRRKAERMRLLLGAFHRVRYDMTQSVLVRELLGAITGKSEPSDRLLEIARDLAGETERR